MFAIFMSMIFWTFGDSNPGGIAGLDGFIALFILYKEDMIS